MTREMVILTEGESDQMVIEKIREKLGIRCEVRPVGGRGRLIQIFGSKGKLGYYANWYQKVVGLFDSHCTDPVKWIDRIENALGDQNQRFPNVSYMVLKHAIETWLIADHNAVQAAFHRWNLQPVANPENVCKPEETLEDATHIFKKRYHKTRDSGKIAQHLDLDIVAEKCPSFHRFKQLVSP